MRPCIAMIGCVRWSIGWLVGWLVTHSLKTSKLCLFSTAKWSSPKSNKHLAIHSVNHLFIHKWWSFTRNIHSWKSIIYKIHTFIKKCSFKDIVHSNALLAYSALLKLCLPFFKEIPTFNSYFWWLWIHSQYSGFKNIAKTLN